MFLSRGDSDLGVAFQTHPGSLSWTPGEAKDPALLSSRHRCLLEPTEWPKGNQAPCGVWREDSGLLSRPCRKRRPSSRDDRGVLLVFSSCGGQCAVSDEVRQEAQGAFHVGPVKSGLHAHGKGERVIALEIWYGNRASRYVKAGLSRSFSGCGRKPWVQIGRAHV